MYLNTIKNADAHNQCAFKTNQETFQAQQLPVPLMQLQLLSSTNIHICFLSSFQHFVDKVSFMIHLSHFILYGNQRKPRK